MCKGRETAFWCLGKVIIKVGARVNILKCGARLKKYI